MRKIIRIGLTAFVSFIVIFSCMSIAYANDDHEPNDNVSQATPINVNEAVYGWIQSYERDYYKFEVPANGYIQIEFRHEYGVGGAYGFKVEMLTYNGNAESRWIYLSSDTNSEWTRSWKTGLHPGTYYVKVSTELGESGNYNFTVNYVETDSWETENNDNVSVADKIELDQTIGGVMGSYESDFYKFTLEEKTRIQVELYQKNGVTCCFEILTYNGNSTSRLEYVGSNVNSNTIFSSKKHLGAGTYYINAKRSTGNGGEYQITVKELPPEPTTTAPPPTTTLPTTTRRYVEPTYAPASTKPVTTKQPTLTKPLHETEAFVAENTTSAENVTTQAAYEIKIYNNFEYTVSNYEIIICKYIGADGYVEIPEEIEGVRVTGIAENAFSDTPAAEIKIPESVNRFGRNAFGTEDGSERKLIVAENSSAHNYAKHNSIDVEVYEPIEEEKNEKPDNMLFIGIIVLLSVIVCLLIAFILLKTKKERNA